MDEKPGKPASVGSPYVRITGDGSQVIAPRELLGVIFLGALALLLFIALQRAHKRNRDLLALLAQAGPPPQ